MEALDDAVEVKIGVARARLLCTIPVRPPGPALATVAVRTRASVGVRRFLRSSACGCRYWQGELQLQSETCWSLAHQSTDKESLTHHGRVSFGAKILRSHHLPVVCA